MKKEIIVNHTNEEIRIALQENNISTELFFERKKEKSTIGNIYKGQVIKVLPGMEAAFVNIGLEKAAFLHINDINKNAFAEAEEDNNAEVAEKKLSITDLLKEKQEIIVQVAKDPISTKGARIVGNINIPGRNLVLNPASNHVGISKQITSYSERIRLRNTINKLRAPNMGFIIRTVAQNRDTNELQLDINYLMQVWEEVNVAIKKTKAPALLYEEQNLTKRTIRDHLVKDIDSFIIDNEEEYNNLQDYLDQFLPLYADRLSLYKKNIPIFDAYNVTRDIAQALEKKVFLPSGGSLIIDQTEALTAIDVNTGSFIGNSNHQDTIVTTNLEAVEELVRQIRLRDIGGIIIIDFIDMENETDKTKVYQKLKEEVQKDKARSHFLPISDMGLVEMTRQRNKDNLTRFLYIDCPYCHGTARVKSEFTIIYSINREVLSIAKQEGKKTSVLIRLNPDIASFFNEEEYNVLRKMETVLGGKVQLHADSSFHWEQYEIFIL